MEPSSDKRGLSEVISTVLIILISIVAVTMLASVLIPYAKNNLDKSQSCFNTIGQIELLAEGSCYNNPINGNQKNTSIRVKFGKINISEIYISLEEGNGKNSYVLEDGGYYQNINNNQVVKMPSMDGGERTYVFNNINSTTVLIGPIINGKRCEVSDSIQLNLC